MLRARAQLRLIFSRSSGSHIARYCLTWLVIALDALYSRLSRVSEIAAARTFSLAAAAPFPLLACSLSLSLALERARQRRGWRRRERCRCCCCCCIQLITHTSRSDNKPSRLSLPALLPMFPLSLSGCAFLRRLSESPGIYVYSIYI